MDGHLLYGLKVALRNVITASADRIDFAGFDAEGQKLLAATAIAWYLLFVRVLGVRRLAAAVGGGFCGFAPGFAYLAGLDVAVSRLETPRTRVPAGSVGLAGTWCGIYPTASPGGWRIIGRTDAVLWDVDRDPPASLVPGTRVRFVAT